MRRWLAWAVAAASVAGLGIEAGAAEAAAGKVRVALVMKSLANDFFRTMEDGARAHQKTHATEYDLIANGIKDEQDVAGQIGIVEQMIANRVNALVIAPANSEALVPVCKRAADAGIVVINIDNKLDDKALADKGLKVPFVGPNNRAGAKLAGAYLATRLKAGDQVAIVEGVPGAFNGIQRKAGFEDAMTAAGLKVVSAQTGRWESAPAQTVVAGMVTQFPDLKAVLCANDNMALGAVAALRSAGKAGQILVVGYDNIPAVQALMKEGKVLCTVDQHADRIAVFGIEAALEVLAHKAAPADRETAVDLVTPAAAK
jgi:ribose transport system substrate-binding protein